MKTHPPSVAIIGAGISGLACAKAIRSAGVAITIFEKSRSLGGRCATRRWEDHIVDHGAQYFTMRDPAFRAEMMQLASTSLRTIEAPITTPDGIEVATSIPGESRYYHAQGNNRLGRLLLGDASVQMEQTVDRVESRPETGATVMGQHFDAVVCSAPWPQTASILGLADATSAESYDACLTGLFSYRAPWAGRSRDVYGIVDTVGPLAWTACENHKAGRIHGEQIVLIAQASPGFSAEHLESEPALWLQHLQEMVEDSWQLAATQRIARFGHRWKYARTRAAIAPRQYPDGIFITGDAFSESRVESAWLVGRQTADAAVAYCMR